MNGDPFVRWMQLAIVFVVLSIEAAATKFADSGDSQDLLQVSQKVFYVQTPTCTLKVSWTH